MALLYDWLQSAADEQGNNKALVYRDNYLSWRGLLHRVDRRAQEFKAMGLGKGTWVGLMLGNVPDFVILALALSKLDAVVVPIDPTTGTRELELIMAAAPLRGLVTRPRGSEASGGGPPPAPPPVILPAPRGKGKAAGAAAAQPAAAPATGVGEPPEIRRRLQGTLLTCSVFKRPSIDFGVEAAAVMITADSLGDPKAVIRTSANLVALADNVVGALDIDVSSRILIAVPLFHAYGWDVGLLPTLRKASTMFLEEEISARRVAKIMRDQSVDVLPGTPTMYAELSRLPTAKPLKIKSTRYVSSGSKLDTTVADAFADAYAQRLLSCYHTTETGVVSIDRGAREPESVGKPVDGVEVKLTSLEGTKTPIGDTGVIWVKGPSLSRRSIGPYDEAEAGTRKVRGKVGVGETDGSGWHRTGDLGKLDRSGKLYLQGREDDLVKVEGKRVALGEVEGCLESFPKVKHAQARVVTDPLTGAMVVAKVVAKTKCQPEEIIDHCARNLAPYKVPRRIEFCERI